MPATRRLDRRGGATFSNAVMPNPLCCPSRASVLTGLHAHNHKVWSHREQYGFHSFDDRSTLAVWLRRSGYITTYLGKYLNLYGIQPRPGETTGHSVLYVLPDGHAGGPRSTAVSQDAPEARRHLQLLRHHPEQQRSRFPGPTRAATRPARTRTSPSRPQDLAAKPAPFFSYVSFTAPHNGGPREADDPGRSTTPGRRPGADGHAGTTTRAWGWFDKAIPRRPAATGTTRPRDKPAAAVLRDPARHQQGVAAHPGSSPPAGGGRRRSSTTPSTAIMTALRQSGELGRTIVVFTSDNGYFLGEQRIRHGKRVPVLPLGSRASAHQRSRHPAGVVRPTPSCRSTTHRRSPGQRESPRPTRRTGGPCWRSRGRATAAGAGRC